MSLPQTSRLGLGLLAVAALAACQLAAPPAAPPSYAPRVRFVPEAPSAAPLADAADWLALWPAWLGSCRVLTSERQAHRAAWAGVCEESARLAPGDGEQVRAFFSTHMDRYRVLAVDADGRSERDTGLMTGYFEPRVEGRRSRTPPFVVPLYGLPPVAPTATRGQLEASGALRGFELLWLRDPVQAFFLEVQGSGRVELGDGNAVRLAFAGSNGQPYRSIGKWLVEQGELAPEGVSMTAIADWARAHPQRLRELLDVNPRMVFFREQVLAQPDPGPIGSLGVPLTPGVSVAVDPGFVPLGAPLLLRLADAGGKELPDLPARPVLAQDTGAAIRGPLRVDWYWGQGDEAGEIAGRQRALGQVRLLVPRGVDPTSLL